LPIPKTKFLEPGFSTFVTGEFQTDLRNYKVDHVPAHQAHIWGTEYAPRWVWGHCNQFEEDSDCVFEGLVAQIKTGPLVSPMLALFHFYWKGQMYKANQIHQWFSNQSEHSLTTWHFEAVCGDTKFIGHLKRDPKTIVGVNYEGPHAEKRYCHNSMRSDMEFSVWKKEKKQWMFEEKLTAVRSAAFETVESDPNLQVQFLL